MVNSEPVQANSTSWYGFQTKTKQKANICHKRELMFKLQFLPDNMVHNNLVIICLQAICNATDPSIQELSV